MPGPPDLVAIPDDGAPMQPDMAEHFLRLVLDQHPQFGLGKSDTSPKAAFRPHAAARLRQTVASPAASPHLHSRR